MAELKLPEECTDKISAPLIRCMPRSVSFIHTLVMEDPGGGGSASGYREILISSTIASPVTVTTPIIKFEESRRD